MDRVSMLIVVHFVLAAGSFRAAAEFQTYRFEETQERSFHYFSGDLPCEIAAHLAGEFTIVVDDNSDMAVLRFSQVTMHSAQTEYLGMPYIYPEQSDCHGFCESIEGSALSAVMPGIVDEIVGYRAASGEYNFGPTLTNDRSFMREFSLEISPAAIYLSGSSVFYGDDGPSYFISGLVTAIPEPTALTLLCLGSVCLLRRR